MKPNIFLAIVLFMAIFTSCDKKPMKKAESKSLIETQVLEHTKLKMFHVAYIHDSTAPYYVVANIKNKNTGEIKEICTEAPFLAGALDSEFNKDYSYNFNLGSSDKRYFELSKDSALRNIYFDAYTHDELQAYTNSLNIDSIIQLLKKEKHVFKQFSPYSSDGKEQIMFAHIMFNNGIMMRRGCEAGNYCTLVLYDSTKVGIDFLEPDWDYY